MNRARTISLRRALVAITLLELIALYVVLRNGSWVSDDNFFLVRAGQLGFTWHWITSPQYEHWDLALNVLYSIQLRLFFFDYRWGLVVLLGLLGACIYMFERTMATLVRGRWIPFIFAVWFGLSVLWIRPLRWWSAGVQSFSYTFLDLLCLYAFLRYQADGARRWIAVSAGALAVALLFYEKPAYLLMYLALFRVLLMSADLRPKAVLAVFWRERLLWASYVAVLAIWGIAYLNSEAHGGASGGGVTLGQYLTYFRILWVNTLVPSLASVTIPASNLSVPQILFVIAAQAVVVGVVVVSVRRKHSAWRAWTFLAVTIVTSGALVARSRIRQFGVDIANEPRYLIDFGWLVPLTLCAAFARTPLVEPHAPEARTKVALPSLRRTALLLAVFIPIIYAAVSLASAAQLQREWPGAEVRSWEQHLRRGIAQLKRSRTPFVVADNTTPANVLGAFDAPYNRLSRVLPMYVGPVQVDGPLIGPIVTVHLDGTVHRASSVTLAGVGAIHQLVQSHQVASVGGRTVETSNGLCTIADALPAELEWRLPPIAASSAGPFYLRLAYRVWRPIAVPVFVDAGKGYPDVAEDSIRLVDGDVPSVVWLGPAAPQRIMLAIPSLTTVCVSQIAVISLPDQS
jgi:hypothetical protein